MVGFTGETQQWEITPELKPMIPVADDLPLGSKRGERIELFRAASLFVSDNGLDWTKVSHIASNDDGEPGLHFRPAGRALVVSRNGGGRQACHRLPERPALSAMEKDPAQSIDSPGGGDLPQRSLDPRGTKPGRKNVRTESFRSGKLAAVPHWDKTLVL